MIRARLTSQIVPFSTSKCRVFFTPDLEAESHLYREFGTNNEIDIVRNNPQYESVVNSRLKQVSDVGLDTEGMSDEMMASGLAYGRSFDDNEVSEAVAKDKELRIKEIKDSFKSDE